MFNVLLYEIGVHALQTVGQCFCFLYVREILGPGTHSTRQTFEELHLNVDCLTYYIFYYTMGGLVQQVLVQKTRKIGVKSFVPRNKFVHMAETRKESSAT